MIILKEVVLISIENTNIFFKKSQYFYFNFSDTPCYRLHKTLPESDWYKGACAQVAKIFRCIDSALRVFGTKDAVLKKLPEICNHISIPRNLVKRSTGEDYTLSPVRL